MRVLISLCFLLGFSAAALAQALPFHADPSAREEAADLAGVPAIRFLTSADFPPFNYRDDGGELVGFHIDLAKAICTVLDVSCTVQAWPWDQVADALASNQGDVLLAGLAIDEISAEQFDFSSLYLMLPGRFVTMRDVAADFTATMPGDKKIAVRDGSAHARFLQANMPARELVPFDNEILALEAVREGEVDAYFGDAMRASFWLNESGNCCAFAGDPYFSPHWFGEGLAAAIPAGRGNVRNAVNTALAQLKRNGKLDELYLRWFPVSFY
ncbi:transporter substrate-binding domain-containing protein [Mariluticola halotolerans]|uniref:transporter substrate-binding domain-containing protein n=1 Tax=Mariluticola halotolerans TaxID=2909283 RepID=UPI0026E3A8D2|nr:transporter substrate-binding domain-containing protein [Mariluticola halotolerans]UJQ93031.1 transporter substrate-binding domain-containing protein [Mariluticola halotolerans]